MTLGKSRCRFKGFRHVLPGSVIALCAALYSGLPAAAQTPQKLGPEGYVDAEGLWPSPAFIAVCWEPAAQPYAQEKGWVSDAVKTLIANASSLHFQDWNDCATGSVGIRITIADQNPNSGVGRQYLRDANGKRQQDSIGGWIQLPTKMLLNFTFDHPAFRDFCKPNREHCIRALAVHEFLHAVGFLHEQLRDDAPADCRQRYGHNPDVRGFQPVKATQNYDPDSHMNYCTNMYRKPIRLSEGDLSVLKRFYPKP